MTNCIEAMGCMPTNPLDVLNIYDVWFGTGMTLLIMALIIGSITAAIYVRTRSIPMLTVLVIYEIATFSSIVTSKYISGQYQVVEFIVVFGIATAITMMVLRLVKE